MRRGILATTGELKALSSKCDSRPFEPALRALEQRCALILESAPVTEAQWRAMRERGTWCPAVAAAQTSQGRIFDLAISSHIDPNIAYRDRAIEELNNLVSWTTWRDPAHQDVPADLCTAEAAVAVAVGLDWLWDDLSETQRQAASDALCEKAINPYIEAINQDVWWQTCYHNWNATISGGVGLAALATKDICERSAEAHAKAVVAIEHVFDALGQEGGWDEGIGYWGYAMRYIAMFAEASVRLENDQSIYHKRGMDKTGLFPVYFTPNGHGASFGDSPIEPLHGALYLLAKRYNLNELTRWLDSYSFHRDVATAGWSAAGLALLFRPETDTITDVTTLEPVKVYDEIGWASLADNWPNPEMYISAKTGDLSAHHAHRDMAAMQLQVGGEMLLTNPGPGQYADDSFVPSQSGDLFEVRARTHNTLVVCDRDHHIDALGSIAASGQGSDYRWITCNANHACGYEVSWFRHIVMILDGDSGKGRLVVVLDEVTNTALEKLEQFWHTEGKVDLNREEQTGTITGKQSRLHFAMNSTVKMAATLHLNKSNGHATDNIIHMSGGLIGHGMLLSVFSLDPLTTGVGLTMPEEGQVIVHAGDIKLAFAESPQKLTFEKLVK